MSLKYSTQIGFITIEVQKLGDGIFLDITMPNKDEHEDVSFSQKISKEESKEIRFVLGKLYEFLGGNCD